MINHSNNRLKLVKKHCLHSLMKHKNQSYRITLHIWQRIPQFNLTRLQNTCRFKPKMKATLSERRKLLCKVVMISTFSRQYSDYANAILHIQLLFSKVSPNKRGPLLIGSLRIISHKRCL